MRKLLLSYSVAKGIVHVVSLIAGLWLGFMLGRWYPITRSPVVPAQLQLYPDDPHPDIRQDNFLAVVTAWQKYLGMNNSFVPEDPYKSLMNSNLAGFDSLRDVHFTPYLPPKLNPEVAKNPRYVVFYYAPSLFACESYWEYYGDGSWAEVPVAHRSNADAGSTNANNWVYDFPKTGLPDWRQPGERENWVQKNANLLRWDEKLKGYVVSTRPTK